MSKGERVILTNICMVTDASGRILLQERIDPGWPGLVFPGGHIERGESVIASVIREVREETGLEITDPRICGVKQFETEEGLRYIVFLCRATRFTGTLRSSEEGKVAWYTREQIAAGKTVTGFGDMLRVFDDPQLTELFYPFGEDDDPPPLFL